MNDVVVYSKLEPCPMRMRVDQIRIDQIIYDNYGQIKIQLKYLIYLRGLLACYLVLQLRTL